MNTSSTTVQALKRALGFPLRDRSSRVATLIAAAIALAGTVIPILPGIVLAGYCARLMRPILADGDEPAMPAWSDLSGMLRDGVRLWGAHVIWLLPGIMVIVVGYALYIGTAIGLPMAATSGRGYEEGVFWVALFGGMALLFGGITLTVILSCLRLVALSHVAATGKFAKAFAFRELWAILRDDWGGWGVSMMLYLGLNSTAQGITVLVMYTVVCCITTPFLGIALSTWSLLVTAALCAGVYRGSASGPIPESDQAKSDGALQPE